MMNVKRILALLLAALLALGCVGCTFSTPAAVGKVGDEEISAGVYLLLQLNAYTEAANKLSDSSADVLSSTIKVDDQDVAGADFIADRTHELLGDYAATRQVFANAGGSLSEEDQNYVHSYAQNLWETNKDTYQANGIGQTSLESFVEYSVMRQALPELLYGQNGTAAPVSDEELTTYINDNYRSARFIGFPLLNYSTYTALDEEGDKTVTQLAQQASERLKAGEDAQAVADELLPQVFTLLGMEYSAESADGSVGSTVFSPSQMEYYGSEVKDKLLAAKPGDALVADISLSRMAMVMEPVLNETTTLDSLRSNALVEMKSNDLDTLLKETAEGFAWELDEKAMKTYSASKIKKA